VAVGYREPRWNETADGLAHLFAINTLAPYVLTALIKKPKRLVYISSGMPSKVMPAYKICNGRTGAGMGPLLMLIGGICVRDARCDNFLT
jgi:hypothetical protein